MVDIVSHANVAAESDAVHNRHHNSSSASSAPAKLASASSKLSAPDAVPPPDTPSDVRLEISQNKGVSGFVYKLVDKKSGKVVRQWPTEQMIKLKEYIAEQQIQLVDEKA